MKPEERKVLELLAVDTRILALTAIHSAKCGHPGGSFSSAEMLTYLYQKEMRVDPENPKWEDRDRFVLSKGHVAPGLYAALAIKGYFPKEDLPTLRHIGSHLQGHPNMNSTPGIDMTTGSLGQGVSAAAGMAKGAKYLKKDDIRVYALLGDGELEEGQVWEAVMFSSHYKLDNLCIIVDVNGLQIDGYTKDVMNSEPIDAKFEAFGCNVVKINGHDFDEIESAFGKFHENNGSGKPAAILMKTVKGKGVSFMEDQAGWHGKATNDEQFKQAIDELNKAKADLEV